MAPAHDTIAAVSTPPGRGAIGVVRLSGSLAVDIAHALTRTTLQARHAHLVSFHDHDDNAVDRGLAIAFPAPASYTGEDIVELHAHGNPVVLDYLVELCVHHGARIARPGEFTERAFRNGKLDLSQAEAVQDFIASQTLRAARSAQRSLSGEFAARTTALLDRVHQAHALIEASLDFADDLVSEDLLAQQVALHRSLLEAFEQTQAGATTGARLARGLTVAIVGAPNVGKSSLLNCLAASERAIVADAAGTTRDTVEVDIEIDGMPVRVIDTAGLHDTDDSIERAGMARSLAALKSADLALLVTDRPEAPSDTDSLVQLERDAWPDTVVVHNKLDLYAMPDVQRTAQDARREVFVSARTGEGLEALHACLADKFSDDFAAENAFTARARHLEALAASATALNMITEDGLRDAPELMAEHYRAATGALQAIGGTYTSEDVLGAIFSTFCIGK